MMKSTAPFKLPFKLNLKTKWQEYCADNRQFLAEAAAVGTAAGELVTATGRLMTELGKAVDVFSDFDYSDRFEHFNK